MTKENAKPNEINWAEATAYFEQQQQATRDEVFTLENGMVLRFVIRGLTNQEFEAFEDQIAKEYETTMRNPRINFEDNTPIAARTKHYYLINGIVKGPEGFTKADIPSLPVVIKNQLSNAINDMTDLSIKVRERFR